MRCCGWHGAAMGLRVEQDGDGWRAVDGDTAAGRLDVVRWPDGRWFAEFADCRPDAYGPLVAAAGDRELHAMVDEDAAADRERLAEVGFRTERYEDVFRIPTDPAVTGLAGVRLPAGFTAVSAADADHDRLRLLGDELVEDVPGVAGWRTTPEEFADMLTWPSFDPATYLTAVEGASGEYAGLVRVWANRAGPRLGLIGVRRPYRRRGLARGLLAEAFGVLHRRGRPEASAEADRTNVASVTLLTSLGAVAVRGTVELRRPAAR